MPVARINDKILFFAHIPKSGGTSVEDYLSRKGMLALKMRSRRGWCKTVPQHLHADLHRLIVPPGFADHSFTIFRDPVARMVSEYRYRTVTNTKIASIDRWVETTLSKYSEQPYMLDNHIRPQVEYLSPGMLVFRFEDGLDPVFDWIDTVTDGRTAERGIWHKRSNGEPPRLQPETRQRVLEFYARDRAFHDRLVPSSPRVAEKRDCVV